ncbi:beta-ketoacyl synthase N-terminal-like domain-containing protein [Seonamhaeicola marinus]|uniref:3-oxoacyl-ACP synthase n=1 Tax=Seonamhaeicola marinus TaxID=1912246 RepID=A0A5D0HUY7_9FLAO|nr:beta-ketoacyl synthase N-terminal-like domain-containing protein [Seonamhaeicola marinus]TYA73957.1 3-oxoacyl-ACP synthase [Seonamhaeicola marinus]
MSRKVYINGLCSISAQNTFDNNVFLDEIIKHSDTVLKTVDPNYKEFIPPASARRMAKGIKMGIVASKLALKDANLETPDAIITGTGLGCVRDSEKFVSTIINHDEQFLTPTPFIQSTHNTVAGQIALELQCKGYNFTYVHGSNSFESALLDAKLQLENNEEDNILIGGVDEIGAHTIEIHKVIEHIKKEPVNSTNLLNSGTKGAVFSEGANFFVVSNNKSENTYAEVVSISLNNTLNKEKLLLSVLDFLKSNALEVDDIDGLVLGYNGDMEYDSYYDTIKTAFPKALQLYYKHLIGEYYSASSFGVWLGCKILKKQVVPEVTKLNTLEVKPIKTILLYNQYRGENHSFTILRKC